MAGSGQRLDVSHCRLSSAALSLWFSASPRLQVAVSLGCLREDDALMPRSFPKWVACPHPDALLRQLSIVSPFLLRFCRSQADGRSLWPVRWQGGYRLQGARACDFTVCRGRRTVRETAHWSTQNQIQDPRQLGRHLTLNGVGQRTLNRTRHCAGRRTRNRTRHLTRSEWPHWRSQDSGSERRHERSHQPHHCRADWGLKVAVDEGPPYRWGVWFARL